MSVKKNVSIFTFSALTFSMSSVVNAFTFQVGDTTADLYGYARLDMIYDFQAKLGNAVSRYAIRLEDRGGPDGHFETHAYQSRLGLSTSTMVGGSELKTVIEGDFWGGSEQGQPRLRHAYAEWYGVLAGQTWTNFGSFLQFTPTVDFYYQPGAATNVRPSQLRYTTGPFSFALEDPETAGTLPRASYTYTTTSNVIVNGVNTQLTSQSTADTAGNDMPDFTARYQGGSGKLKYSASAVLRELSYDATSRPSTPQGWDSDKVLGWGLNVAASAKVSDRVTLRIGLTHGDGIGSYQLFAPFTSPAYVNKKGSLQTIKGTGGTAGISIAAGKGNINLSYGIATVDLDEGVADGSISATTNKMFDGTFLNYIWSPVKNISCGIEAGYHTREQYNGEEGHAVRLQGMVQYNF